MRSDSSLDSVLRFYRRFSTMRWAVLALGTAAAVATLVFGPGGSTMQSCLLGVVTAALCALAGLQYMAERSLALRLSEADQQRWRAIDMAHRDALTGVYNRAYFFGQLEERLGRGSRIPVGYLQVDMDHLKALNDGLGHAAGDTALLHLTNTIRRLRPEAVLGRLGGDEFGVALIGEGSKDTLLRLGEDILAALRHEVSIEGRMMPLSATIGVAVAPEDAADVPELMSRADLALYRGKRNGRSQVVGYDSDMLVDERHHRFVQRELRAALLLNEIKVYYQPIYCTDGVTLRSYEALMRWHHAHRGVIAPGEFIPIAEQSDIIDRLSEAMLRQVCADLPQLGVPVAINISPVQLRRSGFAARFAAILLEAGIAGDRITIEITENLLMRAGGIESANLEALRALGVRIAIDDLGTGHASLEYLRSFAFDIIKIDRSYVAHLLGSAIDRTIISAVCDIARAINVEVIAEGVETAEQLAALQEIGCNGVQGYLLGRPAPLPFGHGALRAVAAA